MTSLLDEPKDRRRRRTRAAILAAASDLFARDGFRATSVEAIAARADIALTSLYGNFAEGKAEVYAVLAVAMASTHEERMQACIGELRGAEAVHAALTEYARFHSDEPFAFRLLGLADVADSEAKAVAQARAEVGDGLARVVSQAISSIGGDPASTRSAVLLAWGGINGVLALGYRGLVDRVVAEELVAAAVELHVREISTLVGGRP